MEMERLARKSDAAVGMTVLIVTFLVFGIVPVKPASAQDNDFTVSCYRGNLEEGNNVGDISVKDPQTAGETCNRTYYECNGKCLGCFFDYDLSEDVCYDSIGMKFLK